MRGRGGVERGVPGEDRGAVVLLVVQDPQGQGLQARVQVQRRVQGASIKLITFLL